MTSLSQYFPESEMNRTLIEKITNAVAGDFDFNNIPQGYDRLIIKGELRGDESSTYTEVYCFVNADTTAANYHKQENSAYAGAAALAETNTPLVTNAAAATSPTDSYTKLTMEIENPGSDRLKVIESHFGTYRAADNAYAGMTTITSAITDAITRLRIQTSSDPTNQLLGELSLFGERW
jgi:hypothetical protein